MYVKTEKSCKSKAPILVTENQFPAIFHFTQKDSQLTTFLNYKLPRYIAYFSMLVAQEGDLFSSLLFW